MPLTADTKNRLAIGLTATAAATEIDAAITAAQLPAAGTVTNAMLAPSALQSTGTAATAALGYATGAGGTVTQITSRTTGVTLSKLSGTIQTDVSSLAAEAAAEFTVTNTLVAIGDVIAVSIQSGTNSGNTEVIVSGVAAGSFKLKVCNNNASGGTAETGAIIVNFVVLKAVSA